MRPICFLLTVLCALVFVISWPGPSAATDYNSRFIHNYPPGFYGMWYKAERFFEKKEKGKIREELYSWDTYMSHLTGTFYPFFPVPFPWDYGTGRRFNLPQYDANDWP
jgi:hypothetical protein